MNLWNSLKSYFSPDRRLNQPCEDNQRCFGGVNLWGSRFPETPFAIISQMLDVNEFTRSFDDIFRRMENDFRSGNGQFYENKSGNGNEYYYENKDGNGTIFSYYKFESGPGPFLMPRADHQPGFGEQPSAEKFRDILIKPEFRNGNKSDDISLDGSVTAEDIRRKFFK